MQDDAQRRAEDQGRADAVAKEIVAGLPDAWDGFPSCVRRVDVIGAFTAALRAEQVQGEQARNVVMEEALRQIAKPGCRVLYQGEPDGFTCLDNIARAQQPDTTYSAAYRDRLLSGSERCTSCIAQQALREQARRAGQADLPVEERETNP